MLSKNLFAFLGCSFFIFLTLGLWSGGAHSDAGDYVTLAIQIVKLNDWSKLLLLTSGRELFSLWLFVLVVFMKILGPYWQVAVLTTSVFSTLSLLIFFKILNIYYETSKSILICICLSISPAYMVISHNALYDAFFIFLFLLSIYLLARGTVEEENEFQFIFQSGLTGSLLSIVHGAGYPYILFLWLFFPLFYQKDSQLIKKWIVFSLCIGFIPVFQMIIWKFFIYDSFFPYFELYDDWHVHRATLYENEFANRHYVRFFLMFVVGNNILILLSVLYFIFTTDKTEKTSFRIFMSSVFIVLILSLLYKVNVNVFFVILINFLFIYHFKQSLHKKSKILVFFGFLSVFTLYTNLSFFPFPYFHQKHFVYPVLFGILIFWDVGYKFLKNNRKIFVLYSIFIFIQFIVSFYFILPNNINLSPKGFNVKYSSFSSFGLPFTNESNSKNILKVYREMNLTNEDKIFTNLPGRYVNSLLNMPQKNYYIVNHSYNFFSGFKKDGLNDILLKLKEFDPGFIHWDKTIQNQYYIDNTSNEDLNKIFDQELKSLGYTIFKLLDENIVFYKYHKNQSGF